VDLGRFILSALIIIGFLLVRQLFAKVVINRLAALTKRTKSPLDDEVNETNYLLHRGGIPKEFAPDK
jgi:MscS family membrane protein